MTDGFSDQTALADEARSALARFGRGRHIVQLASIRENAVFEVRDSDGARAALRLHRTGYHELPAIRSELLWLTHLRRHGLAVPAPIPASDGRLAITTSTGRAVSLLDWVSGPRLLDVTPESGAVEVTGPEARPDLPLRGRLFFQLGAMLARLHNASDRFDPPAGFVRPVWNCDGFLGETPLWGRFWEHPGLTADTRGLLVQARRAVKTELEAFVRDGADFGLIHADPLEDNVIVTDAGPVAIDFDDSGYGFRMYDLAVALYRRNDEPQELERAEPLRDGYRRYRPLPDSHWQRLSLFLLLRSLACLGWIVPRTDIPGRGSRHQRYLQTAIQAAQRYLGTR